MDADSGESCKTVFGFALEKMLLRFPRKIYSSSGECIPVAEFGCANAQSTVLVPEGVVAKAKP